MDYGFHVMVTRKNHTYWLAADEHTWITDIHASACFTTRELAFDIGDRECPGEFFTVMQAMQRLTAH